MVFAIVVFLKDHEIDDLRKKYDSRACNIKTHITILYPFPEVLSGKQLARHVSKALINKKSFAITTDKTIIDYGASVHLSLCRGEKHFYDMQHILYTGKLAKFQRQKHAYHPHITLAIFEKKEDAEKLCKKYPHIKKEFFVHKINILQLDTDNVEEAAKIPEIIWQKVITLR